MEYYAVGKTNVLTWLNLKSNVECKKEAMEGYIHFKTHKTIFYIA